MKPFEVKFIVAPLVPDELVEVTKPSSRILFNSTDTCGTRKPDFEEIDDTVPDDSDKVKSKILRWRPLTFLGIMDKSELNFHPPLEIIIIGLVISTLIFY